MKIKLNKAIKEKKTNDEIEVLTIEYEIVEPIKNVNFVIGEDGEKYLPEDFDVIK